MTHSLSLVVKSQRSSDNPLAYLVTVTNDDLNEIKINTMLATSSHNTWLSLTSEAAEDAASNALVPVLNSSAIQVSIFTNDTTGPQLLQYSLNLDTGRLVLNFSETIRLSSYIASGITFQNMQMLGDVTSNHTLSSGMVLGTNGPIVTVMLSPNDLNSLKSQFNLATGLSNTYLVLDSTAFTDMSMNSVDSISRENARQVSAVTPDNTNPQLDSHSS